MGHPVLRERAKPVEKFATPELRALLQDMQETMAASKSSTRTVRRGFVCDCAVRGMPIPFR